MAMGELVDQIDSQGRLFYGLAIAMVVLSTVSVGLRLWSRLIAPAKLWWDDWLAFAAWGCCICYLGLTLNMIHLGLADHDSYTAIANLTQVLKFFYMTEIAFYFGLVFAKSSVLLFYWRIFSSPHLKRRFRITFWTTACAVSAFAGVSTWGSIFSCTPPKKYWSPEVEGHCVNVYTSFTMFASIVVADMITDLMILTLPLPVVSGLHIPPGRKISLSATFAAGYLAWITSIGRMCTYITIRSHLHDPNSLQYQMPNIGWTIGEIGVSVFSICIPTWFNLYRQYHQGGFSALVASRRPSGDSSESKQPRSSYLSA